MELKLIFFIRLYFFCFSFFPFPQSFQQYNRLPSRIVLGSNWRRLQQCLHWMPRRSIFIGHWFNQSRRVQQLRGRKEKSTPRCHFEYELYGLCCQHLFKSNRVLFLQCLLFRPQRGYCWECSLWRVFKRKKEKW